jgi:hypothetical protein
VLRGGIAQSVPYTATIYDLFCSPSAFKSFLIHPQNVSCRNQRRYVVTKHEKLARDCREFLPAFIPFIPLGFFDIQWNLTVWGRRLYFPSDGSRATDFIGSGKPLSSAWYEPTILGSNRKHDNQQTTEGENFVLIFNEPVPREHGI